MRCFLCGPPQLTSYSPRSIVGTSCACRSCLRSTITRASILPTDRTISSAQYLPDSSNTSIRSNGFSFAATCAQNAGFVTSSNNVPCSANTLQRVRLNSACLNRPAVSFVMVSPKEDGRLEGRPSCYAAMISQCWLRCQQQCHQIDQRRPDR